MNKLPAIQFYPGDWRKDPGVQSLGYHDRGVWFEILLLMHESSERGVLLLGSKPMPESALSQLLGLDKQILTTTLTTLLSYEVASRREDGALFCRRMVRDNELRRIRSEAGKLGGNPNLLKQKSTTDLTTPEDEDEVLLGTKKRIKIKKEDPKRDPAKIEYAPGIFLLAKEYTKLLAVMTEPEITYWLNELSTAAKNQKAAFQKKYSDHYLTLLSWRRRRLEDGKTWDGGRGLYVKNQNGHGARSGGLLGDGRTTTQIYLDALAEDERNNMKKETQ